MTGRGPWYVRLKAQNTCSAYGGNENTRNLICSMAIMIK